MLLLPRYHFKTSIATIAGTVWNIINNPDITILLLQVSADKATENISKISDILLSDRFRHYFGELVPETRKRWNQTDIEVVRKAFEAEPTVAARGVTSRIVGGHYHMQIFDDVIDEKTAESDAEMEKVHHFFQHSPFLLRPPISRCVQMVVGTRYRFDDIYQRIKDMGSFEVMEAGAYVDERAEKFGFGTRGEILCPEICDESELEAHRKVMSPWVFSCQMLNKPVSDDLRRFRQDDILHYYMGNTGPIVSGEEFPLSSLYITMTCDPSMGESRRADESAITVCGQHSSGKIFVLDSWSGRVNPIDLIDRIIVLYQRWKPIRVGIEDVGFQKALRYYLEQEQINRGISFPVIGLKTSNKSKKVRIEGLSPFFNNRQVYMQKAHTKLAQQLINFPDSMAVHDDLADSLAYHAQWWRAEALEEEDGEIVFVDDDDDIDRYYGLECVS